MKVGDLVMFDNGSNWAIGIFLKKDKFLSLLHDREWVYLHILKQKDNAYDDCTGFGEEWCKVINGNW